MGALKGRGQTILIHFIQENSVMRREMAIKSCKECGSKVSGNAKACPQCGVIRPSGMTPSATWWLILIVLFVVIATFRENNDQGVGKQQIAENVRVRNSAIALPQKITPHAKPSAAVNTTHERQSLSYTTAQKIVMSQTCSEGGTIDQCLNKKVIVPTVEDLGWKVYPRNDGFEVERLMLLNQTKNMMKLSYRWHVDFYGVVKPINGKAMGLTK